MSRSSFAILIAIVIAALLPVASRAAPPPDFGTLVSQDVAAGYYTQAQGADLVNQYEQAESRVNAAMDKATAATQQTAANFTSGHQDLSNQLGSLTDGGGHASLGGTPEQVQEQAQSIYNAMDSNAQLQNAVADNVKPVLDQALAEVDQITAARAKLINDNPNVSSSVKYTVNQQSAALHDYVVNTADRVFDKMINDIQTARDNIENNKAQIVGQLEDLITTNVKDHGPDPSKWPKSPTSTPTPPAKPTPPGTPPPQQVAQNDAKPPTPVPPKPGVIPPTGEDPALKVPDPVVDKGKGTGKPTTPDPKGTPTPGSSSSGAKVGTAITTAPPTPNGTKPPPTPTDYNKIPPVVIHQVPYAVPPSENPSPDDQPAVTYNAPPGPPGKGGNVTDKAPPGNNGPVFAPSQTANNDLPPPASPPNSPPPHVGQNPNNQTTAQNDPAFKAPSDDTSQDTGSAQTATGIADAAAEAAAAAAEMTANGQGADAGNAAAAGAGVGATSGQGTDRGPGGPGDSPPPIVGQPGRIHIVDGEEDSFQVNLSGITLPALSLPQNYGLEYGDTVTVAALAPIYAGYNLNDHTGDAMMSLDLHAPAPSSLMTVPSLQLTGYPSPVMVVPSTQLTGYPSSVMTVPSNQLTGYPSPVMGGLPVLCGR